MKISIVGNAKSIFKNRYGDVIDSSDIVIRFNGGKPTKPESQGKKTNILVYMNPAYTKAFKQKNLIYWHTANFPERRYVESILGFPPSNGVVALEKVKNDYTNSDVKIFGFDWKKTQSFWKPDRPTTKHNYEREEEYCRDLIAQNNWKLYT